MHAGPFGNIAHGNSSIIADEIALQLVGENGFVLTEAGFGADMGGEKFCNIKCRMSGLTPDAGVIVATVCTNAFLPGRVDLQTLCQKDAVICEHETQETCVKRKSFQIIAPTPTTPHNTPQVRALKFHAGKTIPQCATPDVEAVRVGFANLGRHIENFTQKFGIPTVVVVNRFGTDSDEEIAVVQELAKQTGASDCVVSTHWADGGKGAVPVAEALIAATNTPSDFKFTYPDDMPLKAKIEAICREIYGASGVTYTEDVEKKIASFEQNGYGKVPDLHGEDAVLLLARPGPQGGPHGLHRAHQGHPCQLWGWFRFPHPRGHLDDARSPDPPCVLHHRC